MTLTYDADHDQYTSTWTDEDTKLVHTRNVITGDQAEAVIRDTLGLIPVHVEIIDKTEEQILR